MGNPGLTVQARFFPCDQSASWNACGGSKSILDASMLIFQEHQSCLFEQIIGFNNDFPASPDCIQVTNLPLGMLVAGAETTLMLLP